jgi:hypothetical protein
MLWPLLLLLLDLLVLRLVLLLDLLLVLLLLVLPVSHVKYQFSLGRIGAELAAFDRLRNVFEVRAGGPAKPAHPW